jgi:acetyltransferase-like isoleucine patch superfamily enzyme
MSEDHFDAKKSLIKRMQTEHTSTTQKYLDIFVGKRSIWELIKYEMLISFLCPFPGAVGFFLRSKLFRLIFNEIGNNVFFGKSLTVRCPQRISIGSNVCIDDYTVLDAKGQPEISYIKIGKDVLIGRNGILSCTDAHIEFGDFVSTGSNCYFTTKSFIKIGSNVSIGPNSYFMAGTHEIQSVDTPVIKQKRVSKGIVVEDNVWIGASVLVLDGVTIGRDSIIGAGSIVNRDIPDYSLAVGAPARVIKNRKSDNLGQSLEHDQAQYQ